MQKQLRGLGAAPTEEQFRLPDQGSTAHARDLYSHGTPLHHAVCSGSLATVQALVEAGADPGKRDTVWNGTPLGWAEHYLAERKDADSQKRYGEIADYLRARPPHSATTG